MPRSYRDPFDNKVFYSVSEMERYTMKYNRDKIPKEYNGDVEKYLFDYRHGFKGGRCQVCGAPTEWDEENKRYKVLCEPLTVRRFVKAPFVVIRTYFKNKGNSCSDIMRKEYVNNIKRVRNTDNLMNDAEYHKMLLEKKKIAKTVRFKGKEMIVIGSYEEKFVKKCNKVLKRSDDLICPGPTIEYYNRVKKKKTFTIWDFYIKSIDTVVSIKDEGYSNDSGYVKDKRIMDVDKFDSAKGLYFGRIELNKYTIDEFDEIYKEILRLKEKDKKMENKDSYVKYPIYYKKYKNL